MSQKARNQRSYVGELEWALAEIRRAWDDLENPRALGDQAKAIDAALAHGERVAVARKTHGLIPDRP